MSMVLLQLLNLGSYIHSGALDHGQHIVGIKGTQNVHTSIFKNDLILSLSVTLDVSV